MTTRQAAPSRIPSFASLEDTAAFWDTHDSTEFEDEFEPASLEVVKPFGHSLVVPLDAELIQRISEAARERGVRLSALTRGWIEEGLARAEADRAGRSSPRQVG